MAGRIGRREAFGGGFLVLNSLSMMAGVTNPTTLGLGEQIFAAFTLGFALQHYYLNAKIWGVGRDRQVREHLRV